MKVILGACLLICLPLLFIACVTEEIEEIEENFEKTVSGLVTEFLYDDPGIRLTLKTDDALGYNLAVQNIRYSELAWGQRIEVTFRYDNDNIVYSSNMYKEVPQQNGRIVVEKKQQTWYRIISYRVLESAPQIPIQEEKGIDLSGDDIYWTIEPSKILREKSEYIEEFRKEIEEILLDRNGWAQRANLRFVYVENQEQGLSVQPLIIFRDTYLNEGRQYDLCDGSAACALDRTKRRCTAAIPIVGFRSFSNGDVYLYLGEGTTNHEIGHCFGFPHFGKGIMSPSSPDGVPSQGEIEILKQYLEQLQTPR